MLPFEPPRCLFCIRIPSSVNLSTGLPSSSIATSLNGILHVRPRPRLLLSGMLDRLILPASRKQPVRILVFPNDDDGDGFEHRLTWGRSFRRSEEHTSELQSLR